VRSLSARTYTSALPKCVTADICWWKLDGENRGFLWNLPWIFPRCSGCSTIMRTSKNLRGENVTLLFLEKKREGPRAPKMAVTFQSSFADRKKRQPFWHQRAVAQTFSQYSSPHTDRCIPESSILHRRFCSKRRPAKQRNEPKALKYWLVVSTPLKNMKVSWDYKIPNIWEKKMFQTTNQKYLWKRSSLSLAWSMSSIAGYSWSGRMLISFISGWFPINNSQEPGSITS
jgi:hypothetical protein